MWKKLKLSNTIAIALVAFVLFVLVIAVYNFTSWSVPDPLAQFITQRTCSFVDWDDFQAFACTDGFIGKYVPLEPSP